MKTEFANTETKHVNAPHGMVQGVSSPEGPGAGGYKPLMRNRTADDVAPAKGSNPCGNSFPNGRWSSDVENLPVPVLAEPNRGYRLDDESRKNIGEARESTSSLRLNQDEKSRRGQFNSQNSPSRPRMFGVSLDDSHPTPAQPARPFPAALSIYEQQVRAWEAFGQRLRGHFGIAQFVQERVESCRRMEAKRSALSTLNLQLSTHKPS